MSDSGIVFVYGALRSGTTVFRLMLDAHPALSNPGEVDYLFDHLHRRPDGTGWRYDVDALSLDRSFGTARLTMPAWAHEADIDGRVLLAEFMGQLGSRGTGQMSLNIHGNLDKVMDLFPAARLIHLLRDPRDVTRSCIRMGWAGTTFHGVESWLRTERSWDRVRDRFAAMGVLELRYEDLMAAPTAKLQDVCAFLGVAFDPVMLTYHENTTYGPPDPSLVGQWRGKISTEELALLEWKLGPLLAERGYSPSGVMPRRPAGTELVRLYCQNKASRWRFSFRRFGASLVLAEKVSRWLKIRSVNSWARRRINARAEQYLQ